jgi:hypothetical protein
MSNVQQLAAALFAPRLEFTSLYRGYRRDALLSPTHSGVAPNQANKNEVVLGIPEHASLNGDLGRRRGIDRNRFERGQRFFGYHHAHIRKQFLPCQREQKTDGIPHCRSDVTHLKYRP